MRRRWFNLRMLFHVAAIHSLIIAPFFMASLGIYRASNTNTGQSWCGVSVCGWEIETGSSTIAERLLLVFMAVPLILPVAWLVDWIVSRLRRPSLERGFSVLPLAPDDRDRDAKPR